MVDFNCTMNPGVFFVTRKKLYKIGRDFSIQHTKIMLSAIRMIIKNNIGHLNEKYMYISNEGCLTLIINHYASNMISNEKY